MCQPKKWLGWLPVLALAALWFVANAFFKVEPIRADLTARAGKAASATAGAVQGLAPPQVAVEGRDVTLSGAVTTQDLIGRVATVVDNETGVRLVNGAPTLVLAQKPYTWQIARDAGTVTLAGFVPDEGVKLANARAASAAFPNLRVVDQQKIAFGAPAGFAAATAVLIPEAAKLASGKLALNEAGLCAEGQAASADALQSLNTRLAAALTGVTRVAAQGSACALAVPAPPAPAPAPVAAVIPPPPSPAPIAVPAAPVVVPPAPVAVAPPPAPVPPVALEWTAQKIGNAIALSGMVPSEQARAALRTAAGGASVTDTGLRVVPNLKPTPNYADATTFALAQLRGLSSGTATLRDTNLTVTGTAATPAIKQAVDGALAGRLPDGVRLANAAVTVRPYVFQARSEAAGVTLEGLVPDQATRASLLALFTGTSAEGKVRDLMQVVAGAPTGFAETARLAVLNLLRMDDGAVRIVDQGVTFYGTTCRSGAKDVAETAMRVNMSAGFTSSSLIEMKKPESCGVCTVELDKVKGQKILFEQGSATLAADAGTSAIIDQVAGILKQCTANKVVVEGHTNYDGVRRGYNNIGLSEDRARSVIAALVARGIAAQRLSPKGFGPAAPLLPHGTPTARERNRRVDFVVQ